MPKTKIKTLSTIVSIGKKKRDRNGQKGFRDKLIKKYQKCPLDNINYTLCDAAHILPHSECDTKLDAYNVNNGILLSSTMHKAFDRNLFTIDENTCKVKILEENILKIDNKDNKNINNKDNKDNKDNKNINNKDNINNKNINNKDNINNINNKNIKINLEEYGLDKIIDKYIFTLDNEESKKYLKKRNELIIGIH